MRKQVLLGLILAGIMALGVSSTATAALPGGNGLIAVTSLRDGNAEIYTMTATGLTQTRLTNNPAADSDPAFSPDGTRIAFVSDRDDGDQEIYVMDADGANQTRLTDRVGDDMDPVFSPDGTRLAIRRNVDGNNEIVLIDATDGGNAVNLTDNAASDFSPDFSPDGTKIVYQRYIGGAGQGNGNEVMLMNVDGSDPVNLTDNPNTINDGRPSFSPDGTRIAFDSNRYDSHFEIHTMDLTGGDVTRVTDIASGTSQEPFYSPDGATIAFRAAGTVATGISRVAAAGGAVTGISTETGDSNPAWQTDDAAPVTNITGGPAEGSTLNGDQSVFTFGSSEPESSFECNLDETDWASCASPFTASSLMDGEHSFQVRSTDLAGNVEAVAASRNFTVVTIIPPVASITSGPASLTQLATATFEFESDIDTATFECRIDPVEDSAWTDCASPVGYSDLADGAHVFEVRAVDPDAGTGPVAAANWTVDTTAPTVELTTKPQLFSGTGDANFEFTTSETATTECRLDPAEDAGADDGWTACTDSIAYAALAEGPHRFEVRATDTIGNVGAPTVYGWTVETVVPEVAITSAPSGATPEITAWFNFVSDNENATFECRLDHSGPAAGWIACESGVEYTDLADGEHKFEVRAVGQGAGPGPVVDQTWTVDTVAPGVTITSGPATPTNQSDATFAIEMNKPGFVFRCTIDAEPAAPCSASADFPGLAAGDHFLLVEALDGDDNVVDTTFWSWKVLAEAPSVTITEAPTAVSGSKTALFKFKSDVPEATFECQLDGGGWTACTSPAGFPGLDDSAHTFEVRAGLAGSAPGAPQSQDWTVDTIAPVVTVTGGPAARVNTAAATFAVSVDDDDATTECRLDEGAWAACSGQVAFTGLADGKHTLRVRSVDAVGNTGLSQRDWSVDSTAPVMNISKAPESSSTAFNASFEFEANEPDSTFACSLDGAAWQACSSVHRETGLERGKHVFKVRGTDAVGNTGDAASHTWRIVAPATQGLTPKVKFVRRVNLDRDGTARIATVKCPEGRCRVTAPKRVSFRLKGKRFTPGVKSPRGWYKERSSEIMLITSAGTRRVVRNYGPAKIKVKLIVDSDNGKQRAVIQTIKLIVRR